MYIFWEIGYFIVKWDDEDTNLEVQLFHQYVF